MTACLSRDDEDLLDKATDWIVTLTSGRVTEADAEQLALWREADPRHDAAFRHVAGLTHLTRDLLDAPPPRVSRRAMLVGGVAVVAGAGTGLARPPLGLWPSFAELMADHRTGVGERYAFAPAPGISVDMNSKTAIALTNGSRGLRLIDGEALVTVREASRAFEVRAGNTTISTMRAAFNVQSADDGAEIVCIEGELACATGSALVRIAARERLAVSPAGTIRRSRANASAATAWRDGLLVFEGTPLVDAVRQINRYRSADIVLTNGAIGNRPVNAVLHTDQIDNAVSQIQQLLNLRIRRLPGGVILMG